MIFVIAVVPLKEKSQVLISDKHSLYGYISSYLIVYFYLNINFFHYFS